MTPHEFVKRLETLCQRHNYDPVQVWHYLPLDTIEYLIDDDTGTDEEWNSVQFCMMHGWRHSTMTPYHDAPYPVIKCDTCQFKTGIKDTYGYCTEHEDFCSETQSKEGCKSWKKK